MAATQSTTLSDIQSIAQQVVPMSNFGLWFKKYCKHTTPKQTKKGALIGNVTSKNGTEDVIFNPAVQYGSFIQETERAHFPFGIAPPFELKAEGGNYNADINLVKNSPEWNSMRVFDLACIEEGYTNRKEWFGDEDLTMKDIERKWHWCTKNRAPNDPAKRKTFNPEEYPSKLRTKCNVEEQPCFELLEYTPATATKQADIRAKPIPYTDMVPNSYGVSRMNYRGLWFAQGNFGPMFQQVRIIKTPGGGMGVPASQFTEGTMTIANELLPNPAALANMANMANMANTDIGKATTGLDLGEDVHIAEWASQVEQEHVAQQKAMPDEVNATMEMKGGYKRPCVSTEETVDSGTLLKKKAKKSSSALEFA